MNFYRLPPVGEKLPLSGLLRSSEENASLRFENYNTYFFDSGTSSLAAALLAARQRYPAKKEVLIPGYCCPDIVSAIVFAGLTPVLVDLAENSCFIDLNKLEKKFSATTLAVIAINFSGIKERITEIKELLDRHDVILIEDSAQLSPWRSNSSLLADYIVLSFGRGKPESVLHGGALLISQSVDENNHFFSPDCAAMDSAAVTFKYILKAIFYNLALSPRVFAFISNLSFLHIGETRFKKLQKICGMSGIARRMLSEKLEAAKSVKPAVKKYDNFFRQNSSFCSLPLQCNADRSTLLRYPVLLPNKKLKDQFVQSWAYLGVSEMYPSVLYEIKGLDWLSKVNSVGNAISFAQRVVTLPCHSGVSESNAAKILNGLAKLAKGSESE